MSNTQVCAALHERREYFESILHSPTLSFYMNSDMNCKYTCTCLKLASGIEFPFSYQPSTPDARFTSHQCRNDVVAHAHPLV
jgi:hypothetical protein